MVRTSTLATWAVLLGAPLGVFCEVMAMANEPNSPTSAVPRNRLADSASPYLLQHADNPVDWYPWGEEAFAAAHRQNKPIFLSIGYSTCHWCHVMEHESFEDEQVARLMNEAFINIKVDREERPDIDGVYMQVCQMLTGSGGWPLTIIMTPERKPFFAATYIPKTNRLGRMGMTELIPRIQVLWHERREQVNTTADEIAASLLHPEQPQTGPSLGEPTLRQAYDDLTQRFDEQYGGFGAAPKFPTPHVLGFLLRWHRRTGDKHALAMVEETLQAMRDGGIYDHVGFGFHRYSTDHKWLVPHFEKMLYDQALLALAYLEAYQATHKQAYAQTARQILAYVLRDMRSPEGAFYCAEDADSEGVEGKFYVWTVKQLRQLLSPAEADLVMPLFGVTEHGNFTLEGGADQATEGHVNILHRALPLSAVAAQLGLSAEQAQQRWTAARRKLLATRQQRPAPYKDDKVLTDWNALAIAALARAAQVLGPDYQIDLAGNPQGNYILAATETLQFINERLRTKDGRLLHRYRMGQAGIAGHLDDYAFLTWALLELYEATFEVDYLQQALELTDIMLEDFWDDAGGGFFFTSDHAEPLLVRRQDIYDGAAPSGNSVALLNLLRLARMTARPAYEEKAHALMQAFAQQVARTPTGYCQFFMGLDFAVGPAYEVVIAADPAADDTQAMLTALRRTFLPNKVVLLRPTDHEQVAIADLVPFVAAQQSLNGKATAYVCRNHACEQPTTDVQQMIRLLKTQNTD